MFIVLCEDNLMDREDEARLIERAAKEVFSDYCFQAFEEDESCLEAARKRLPDIAFIDIFLGEKSGIELVEAVRNLNPEAAVVFLTMSNEFASESYRVRATDYLLKPAGQEEIVRVLRRCAGRQKRAPVFLAVQQDRQTLKIDQRKIEKLESQGNYLLIYTISGEIIRTRSQLKKIQEQLSKDMLKIRRGVVVNMRCIQTIKGGICRLNSGEEIMLSRQHAKEIREKYYDYQYALLRKDRS